MDGKKYKLRGGARLHKPADRINSAHDRHGDIGYNDVRTETQNSRDQRSPVGGRADKFKMRLQEGHFEFQEVGVVIG
jgi:hypothetical protein